MRMSVLKGGVGYVVWKSCAKVVFACMLRMSFGANERRRSSEEGSILIRGFFKGIGVVAISMFGGAYRRERLGRAFFAGRHPDFGRSARRRGARASQLVIVLGASVYADGSLSPLENRVDAAIDLYNRGLASTIIMSGDGREANSDEPSAMKRYAVERGVPSSDVCCDEADIILTTPCGASRTSIVPKAVSWSPRCVYRSVFDARGVGLDTVGVVSDKHENQFWYDVREMAGRVRVAVEFIIGAVPDNPGAAISL